MGVGKGAVFHGVVRKSDSKEATTETWMKGSRGSWDDLWEGCSRQRRKASAKALRWQLSW